MGFCFTTIIFASDTFITLIKQIAKFGIPFKVAFIIILFKPAGSNCYDNSDGRIIINSNDIKQIKFVIRSYCYESLRNRIKPNCKTYLYFCNRNGFYQAFFIKRKPLFL